MKHLLFSVLAAVCAVILGRAAVRENYIRLDGRLYPRDAAVLVLPEGVPDPTVLGEFSNLRWLDLRGKGLTPEQYAAIARCAGDAEVIWELDFQGGRLNAGVTAVQVRQLTAEDAAALAALPRLRRVDARLCRDGEALEMLSSLLPRCAVEYTVELGGVCMSGEECAPAPGRCTAQEVRRALARLPKAEHIDLRRTGIPAAQARELAMEHPQCSFLWEEELGGVRFRTDAAELDFSGIPMEGTEEIEALLPFLPNLRRMILCDCGIGSETMAALGQRHPKIRFVWRVKLGPLSARTDDTWFAPITKGQLIGGSDADELKYCIDMECIDLGHCWIRNCEWARGMKKLRYLVLADTYVRDLSPLAGLKNLTYLELFVTPVRDYSPLLGCTGLEDLNLGYTYGDPAPVAKMTWLKNLWWGGLHHVPWYGGENPAVTLQRGLPDTRLKFYAGSSTGLGWRELPHYYEMRDRIGMYYMKG